MKDINFKTKGKVTYYDFTLKQRIDFSHIARNNYFHFKQPEKPVEVKTLGVANNPTINCSENQILYF